MRDVPTRTLIPLRHAEAREGPSLARRAQTASSRTASSRPVASRAVASRAVASRAASGRATGFTLIEMIVVVTIIGLLLAIAVPVSVGLVRNKQSEVTKANFETLKVAIDTYTLRRPGQNLGGTFGDSYRNLFGHFPPSPTAAFQLYGSVPQKWRWSVPTAPQTTVKFTGDGSSEPGLINAYLGGRIVAPTATNTWVTLPQPAAITAANQFSTIECLLIFLRTYSPEARVIVDRLGQALTNEDRDGIDRTGNGLPDDELYEVRDTWGTAVQYNLEAVSSVGSPLYRWELRSAGQDKMFLPPFSSEDAGDDVVVSGSAKFN